MEGRDAWFVLAAAIAVLTISYAAPMVAVIALKPIAADLGVPRSVPALAGSADYCGSAVGGLIMGWAADRFGIRRTAPFGAAMVGLGLLISAQGSQTALLIGHGLFIGLLGQASLFAPLMTLISRWFDRRRGTALALVAGGQYIAGMIWPAPIEAAVQAFGWQRTMTATGLIGAALMVPLCLLLRPAPVPPAPAPAPGGGSRARVLGLPGWVVQAGLAIAIFLCCIPMAIPPAHLVAICTDSGLAAAQGAWMLSGMLGVAFVSRQLWGWLADRIGRRPVFIATLLNVSLATGLLAATPEDGWIFLVVMRFFAGFGVGGVYSVDLPLVQEFVPARRRGRIGGLVTVFIPVGVMVGAVLGGFLQPLVGWRGLCLVGLAPAALTLPIRARVPESPHWLVRMGRPEAARRALAWALMVPAETLPMPSLRGAAKPAVWTELFRHPKSLAVSWAASLGAQTGAYGVALWTPTLFVLLLHRTPQEAASLFVCVTLGGLAGRIVFALLSDGIGRRTGGIVCSFAGAALILLAGVFYDAFLGTVSLFWLLLIAAAFFFDGGFAILGPYMAEVWPTRLRATGLGAAYGFGGLGKIIGPLGLALIAGSSDVVTPEARLDAIVPAFAYLAGWCALAGLAFLFVGFETRGRSIDDLDEMLDETLEEPGEEPGDAPRADPGLVRPAG
jgi:putative MFS transporter